MVPDKDILAALTAVKEKYGVDIARTVERMYRLETSHFKSEGFTQTFSAGMERHGELFPYGWRSMRELWKDKQFAPVGFWDAKEGKGISNNGGKRKTFLRFASVQAAMFSLAEYITVYNPGRWYSTVPALQSKYVNKLLSIIPKFVNSIK